MQVRPESANEVVVEVPTWVYGPPLAVPRKTLYEVAPETAVQETVAVVVPVAEAVTPVGADGGVQTVAVGVTEMQVEGSEAQASLPLGKEVTW